MHTLPVENRVAVITGAERGIGLSIARGLRARGWRKFVLHSLNETSLQRAYASDEWDKADLLFFTGDVADHDQVARFVDEGAQHFGQLDVLFNVAGVAYPGGILSSELDAWARSWRTNVEGFLAMARSVAPRMIEQGAGHIVNLSSIWALKPSTAMAPYSTSKHAVQGLSDIMREEFGPRGVKVSTVVLDKVNTGFREHMPSQNFSAHRLALMLDPDEVARIVIGLTDTDSATNISSISVDAWRWE